MTAEKSKCVLLAGRHHGLTDSMRGLLETVFDTVVMVADENSLLQSADRLQPNVAVVDLSLASGENLIWLRRLRDLCPRIKILALSIHDEPSVRLAALQAGADGFVLKRCIANELLPAIDAVLADNSTVPPGVNKAPVTPPAQQP